MNTFVLFWILLALRCARRWVDIDAGTWLDVASEIGRVHSAQIDAEDDPVQLVVFGLDAELHYGEIERMPLHETKYRILGDTRRNKSGMRGEVKTITRAWKMVGLRMQIQWVMHRAGEQVGKTEHEKL
jgi:hypothetical protein